MGTAAGAVQSRSLSLEKLLEARSRTDDLFSIVRPAAIYDRPIPERHRIIFYVGHLEAFDWNLLGRRLFEIESFSPPLDQLFAFGIDPVDGGLPTDRPEDWPSIETTLDYVQRTRAALDDALAVVGTFSAEHHREVVRLLNVSVEHRLMHAETLCYMLHQLPLDRKLCRTDRPAPLAAPSIPRMIEIPAGAATLGLKRGDEAFGWDNEFGEHAVFVPKFRIDALPVANGEFLRFMDAGGYQEPSFWQTSDWDWRESADVSHPLFWVKRGNDWYCPTMFDEVRLPLDWPVYVSQAEAAAYARWAGKELPSEAEWHRAAYGTPVSFEREYPWGNQSPDASRGNFDFDRWNPTPVGAFPAGASAFGALDMLGNGWEWTRTKFAPFEGFQAFPFYPGYSANFFDNRHYVMKGGSSRTAACMLRRSFRNWFQPHYGYVYAGFRCVEHCT